MLEIKDIKFEAANFSAQFNLKIEDGKFYLLLGPSAAGKTTLLHLICGFLSPSSGQIFLDGKDIAILNAAKRPISLMFQKHNLFEHLNIMDNIAIGIKPNLRINNAEKNEIIRTIEYVGLKDKANSMPVYLSGGEAQRVAIARALIRKQKFLLLDEPLSSLDPPLRLEMIKLIKYIGQNNNLTIMMISHTPAEVLPYADKLVFIEDGKNQPAINIKNGKLPKNASDKLKDFLILNK